jgi:ribonuclease E
VSSQPTPSPAEHETHAAEQPATIQPPVAPVAETEAQAQEAEKAARRRSTVREKVSFGAGSQAETTATDHHQPQPAAAPAEVQSEPAGETATDASQPRRAGWWSRRFGGGE